MTTILKSTQMTTILTSKYRWGFLLPLSLIQILLRPGIAGHGHRPLVASVILFVASAADSVEFHEHFEREQRELEGVSAGSILSRVKALFR